jgi:hypothetical protein
MTLFAFRINSEAVINWLDINWLDDHVYNCRESIFQFGTQTEFDIQDCISFHPFPINFLVYESIMFLSVTEP